MDMMIFGKENFRNSPRLLHLEGIGKHLMVGRVAPLPCPAFAREYRRQGETFVSW